ncbi:MAG: DUF4124 domain-containing protein [Casimicrobiaceae bacterium]
MAAMTGTTVARADIYRWIDKNGDLNYSDVAPSKEQAAKDVTVVTRSSKPVPASAATQQTLLARIQNLEQQLHEQRAAPPTPSAYVPAPSAYGPAPPAYAPAAYATPAPYYTPPVPAPYYDAYAGSGYDRAYLAPSYAYPLTPAYSYSVYFVRNKLLRSVHTHRGPMRGPLHGMPGRGAGGAGPRAR